MPAPRVSRWALVAAGALGAAAVAIGAYTAHGLPAALARSGYGAEEVAHRVANAETGVRYQLHAAAALAALGVWRLVEPGRRGLAASAAGFTLGALVFSGLLYALAVSGPAWRFLGAIVPIGGLAMIAAWMGVAVAALRGGPGREAPSPGPADSPSGESPLVRLEELLTHQQQTLSELDEAIRDHRAQTDAQGKRLVLLEAAVRRLSEAQASAETLPHEKPPHY